MARGGRAAVRVQTVCGFIPGTSVSAQAVVPGTRVSAYGMRVYGVHGACVCECAWCVCAWCVWCACGTYRDGVKDVYELSIHSDEALWRVDERGSGLGIGF